MALPIDHAAPSDFDFIVGQWRVRHRRLNQRLTGCTEWTEFEGLSSTTKILGGFGNVEDNILRFPTGNVRAAAMRSFDRESGTWSIWWLDGRNPTWEQAFSPDGGATWETNWTMEFSRLA